MNWTQTARTDSFVTLDVPGGTAPLVLTCEHASPELPDGRGWGDDEWLYGTHWSYDIGAAALTRDLAVTFGAPAVLAQVSRLWVDLNREVDSPTLFLSEAEGQVVHMNAQPPDELRKRLRRFYEPYHQVADAILRKRDHAMVLAVHSFTPVFKGVGRNLDVGVLFGHDDALGMRVTRGLKEAGLRVLPNVPYSGLTGHMFAAQRLGERNGRPALELEVRQDLAASAPWRARFARALAAVLGSELPAA